MTTIKQVVHGTHAWAGAGFPAHPHRGCQTVTHMLNGKIGHEDSVGNVGLLKMVTCSGRMRARGLFMNKCRNKPQTQGSMRGF